MKSIHNSKLLTISDKTQQSIIVTFYYEVHNMKLNTDLLTIERAEHMYNSCLLCRSTRMEKPLSMVGRNTNV
jgi:hypothetical protein